MIQGRDHFLVRAFPAIFLFFPLSFLFGAQNSEPFERAVAPFVVQNCFSCHNDKTASGGLNLRAYPDFKRFQNGREEWERVLEKLKSGEMPPKGIPKPPAERMAVVTSWLETEFQRQDEMAKPDPGRVTARRLNRYEYNATIRDLLAVDFRPANDFPADGFSYGFDNIGDALTLTPLLLQKYLAAAKKVSRMAVEPEPLPKKPFNEHRENQSASRNYEWDRSFPWTADYDFRFAVGGRKDPGKIFVSMDGAAPTEFEVSTKSEEARNSDLHLHLTAGMHKIRVWVVRDDQATLEESWKSEQSRSAKTGATPRSREELKKMLADGTLPSGNGSLFPPYPQSIDVKGPYNGQPAPLPAGYKLVFTCGHAPGHHTPACARQDLTSLARRAWRRPVSDAEGQKLVGFVRSAEADGRTFEQAMEVGVEAVLVSPYFLFRLEKDPRPTDAAASHRISDYELATRLSYFLWSSMPDEELFRLAATGELHKAPVLREQVSRMLQDPKANALADNFGSQWLEFRNLEAIRPDPVKFPAFNGDLRDAMRRETELFLSHLIRENGSILDLLTAKYTYLNEPLAKLYGIKGVTGEEFRKVDLHGTPRVGILTQASVLTVSSYATRTSPVIRGKWILENVLNAPPPPPPADVPALDESGIGSTESLRQQLEKHRSNAVCAGCHSRMDPLGFGLENFDAIGRWRTHDGKFPIDSTGTLPNGKTFSTPEELVSLLKSDKDAFARCVTEKLLIFALGRGLEPYDRPAVNLICRRAAADHYQFQDLIMNIIDSAPFQMRHGESAKAKTETKPKTETKIARVTAGASQHAQ